MTTSHAVDAAKAGTEKVHEKLAEKRRALGRGLESLLPGPRVVTAAPTLPQSARKGWGTRSLVGPCIGGYASEFIVPQANAGSLDSAGSLASRTTLFRSGLTE